jgi:cell division septation protein DedD
MIAASQSPAAPAPEEDVTTTLYRAAIGPVSTGYYLPIFTRFEAADHAGISWNTAAALSTLNWLAFRRLWGAALAYLGALVAIVLLVFGIGRLVFQLPDALVGALALGFGLAAFVLPGLFGNAIFHTDCRKRMSRELVAHSAIEDACAALNRQSGTRNRAMVLAAANVVFWTLAVLLYLQFSAWSNLTVMPQGALEAGHVAVGRTVDITNAASAPASTAVRAYAPLGLAASNPATVAPASMDAASAAPAPAPGYNCGFGFTCGVCGIAAPGNCIRSGCYGIGPVVVASQALNTAPRPSAPVAALAAPATMAMADTMRQSASKTEPLPKSEKPVKAISPAKPVKPVEMDKPAKAESKAAPATPTKPVKTEKPAKPQKPAKTPASAVDKPYFINVGLFAVAANADRTHARLLEAQLPSMRTELKSSKGPQIRVRVGPFTTKQDAQDAAAKIKAMQLDAMIVQP